MLVENQYVDMRWTSNNKDWYTSRGYVFTKYRDKFKVLANDLTLSSKVYVDVVCDYCGKRHSVPFQSYAKGRRVIQKDSCTNCVGNKCAEITLAKRQDDYYQRLSDLCDEIGYELKTPKEEIRCNRSRIKYICPKHGIHEMRAANFLTGKRCPDCHADGNRIRFQHSEDDVVRKVESCGGVVLNPEEYVNDFTKNLRIECPNCGDEFITSLRHFTQHGGQVCRKCSKHSESTGERRVRQYLERKEIPFKQEHWFSDCRDINPLPFDFYLPDISTIIEFDGRQHFGETNFFSHTIEKTLAHDKIKDAYCENNDIRMIRIPYWHIGNVEKILDNELQNTFT